jgi:RimJ/RimL family protein N-acetyltransferase
LTTERLRLRGHRVADFDACAALWSAPEVVRFISGRPSTREETWGRMLRYAGHWALLGFGYWLIEERQSGRFVGEGGFADFQRGLGAGFDTPEQGWALAPWAHGQGFAREATTAMIAWAEAHFGRRDFFCLIAPDNAPSLKLAAKLGYEERARTLYHGEPTVLLKRS